MAQVERLKEEKRGKVVKGKQPSPGDGKGRLISFNPTEPERLAIKQIATSLEDVVYGLGRVAARGCKVTWGYYADSDSYYAIVREVKQEWSEAMGISAMHRDLVVALASVLYACEEKYPGFPDATFPQAYRELDW